MAASIITWLNKVGIIPYGTRINQWQDRDSNEVKDAINNHAGLIDTNTSKTGITTQQATDITTNNSKISYTDATAVGLNTAKETNANHSGDATGDTASTTLLLPVIVTGVADAATISASGSGVEDNHIALDLNAVNEDSDSETLSYMISDVPNDVTLYRVDDEGNAITIDNDEYARIGEFGGFSDTGGTNWIISGDDLDNI